MASTRAVRLVAMRELREGLRNRALRITFAVMVLGVVAAAFVPLLVGGDDTTTLGIADTVTIDEPALVAGAEAFEIDLETVPVADDDAAVAGIEDGELDAAVAGTNDAPELIVDQQADPTVRALVADVMAQQAVTAGFAELGVDADEVDAALSAAPELTVRTIDEPQDAGAWVLAFAGTILLFIGVTFFASRVLTGVVEEKSSRVVEVVLGAMRPEQLLAGKLIGIGVLAIGQILVLATVAIASIAISGAVDLPTSAAVTTIVGFVIWFVIGFATYSVIYAAAGALVSRVEDAQSSSGPVGTLLTVAYVMTFVVVVPNPDGLVSRIFSQLPGVSPMAMPARIALGAVTWIEVVVAIVISLVAIVGAVRVAGIIYRRSVLRTQKATWREALRSPTT